MLWNNDVRFGKTVDKTVGFVASLGALVIAAAGCRTTGGTPPAAPVNDGAAEQAAQARFVDVREKAGIRFRYTIPGSRPTNILQTMPGGCAFVDYDNDGNLDVLLISQTVALYRGDGQGGFSDVTHDTGLDTLGSGLWMGCAVGDYDGDGFSDIYISKYRGGALLHNDAGQRFSDTSREAGIPPQKWGTACAFGDYDNDGKLDLYIGNYIQFGPNDIQLCNVKNIKTSCSPSVYKPERGLLYRNEGGGRFRDVTRETGMDKATGKVLGVLFLDADGSGRQSLFLANDGVPSDLMINTDGGHFKNVGEVSGVAYTESGKPYGGMGVDQADVDGDGLQDLTVGTFALENKFIFMNQGNGVFVDRSAPMGVAMPAMPYLTFGAKFFDFDNDGSSDVIFANGYVADNVHEYEPTREYRQPTLLFRNNGGTGFTDLSRLAGPDLQKPIVGRGCAVGDYDNDGRVDVLIADCEGAPLLLHNETPSPGHYLSLKLVATKGNRDAYGAIVTAEYDGKRKVQVCQTQGSYLSASDKRVHFGLGAAKSAEITIRWPDGTKETCGTFAADREVTITQGAAATARP
jgi:hypothetical protein